MDSRRAELLRRHLKERGVAVAASAPERLIRSFDTQVTVSTGDIPAAVFPASFAQELMWVNAALDPDSAFYNVPVEVRIRGDLSTHHLRAAFVALLERHEVLRTVYRMNEGRVEQLVLSEAQPDFRVLDLTALPVADRHLELARVMKAFVVERFDLQTGPITRAMVVKVEENLRALAIVVHHIAFDGTAKGTLTAELLALYEAACGCGEPRLPTLSLQYADYSVWERSRLTPDVLAKHVDYFRSRLAAARTRIDLPTDRTRPSAGRLLVGRSVQRVLPAERVRALHDYVVHRRGTLFSGLSTVLVMVLHKWSGESDLVFGTVHQGRTSLASETMLGNFVNFVAVRVQLDPDAPIETLYSRVSDELAATFEHGEAPFEKVVSNVQQEKRTSGTEKSQGLYNVALLYQNYGRGTVLESGSLPLRFESSPLVDSESIAVDLRVVVEPLPDGSCNVSFEYATELFDAPTIERLSDRFLLALEVLVDSSELPLSRCLLATTAELELLETWGRERRRLSPALSLSSAFEEVARFHPSRRAVTFEGRSLTYTELDRAASALADRLVGLGARPEARIGLMTEPNLGMIVGLLAIIKAGAAYVPLDPKYPKDRLELVARDAGIVAMVRQGDVGIGIEGVATLTIDAEGHAAVGSFGDSVGRRGGALTSPENVAYVIYTSGSTGKPKGVLVTHANVLRLFEATRRVVDVGVEDVWSLFHSIAFDFSVWEIWGALLHGGRLVIVPSSTARSPDELHALIRRERVSVLSQTPLAFRQLLQTDRASDTPIESLRYVVFGGDALDVTSLRPWFEKYGTASPQLVNMYGITETTVHVTMRPLSLADTTDSRSYIGTQLDDLAVRVLDSRGSLAIVGAMGELFVSGGGVARGYLGKPELTAQRFLPDPSSSSPGARMYRSGDLVRYSQRGDLEYLGRADQQVKIRGYRIELGEIEASMLLVAGVRAAVVVARETADGTKSLVAYYVVEDGADLSQSEVRERLEKTLPSHMVPSHCVRIDAVPMTTNGKVDRAKLPAPPTIRNVRTHYVAPCNPVEDAIANIWQPVLDVERVGVNDNFFELGGHSLLAIQVVNGVRSAFGVTLPLRTLFDAPTIAGLAQALEARRELGVEEVVLPEVVSRPSERFEPFPLTDIQQAYWVGRTNTFDIGNVACHVYIAAEARSLDLPRFERAIQLLIERHEMLRAVVLDDGTQRILESVPPYQVGVDDLRSLSRVEADAQRAATRDRMSHQVHPADRWPLFEFRVTRMDEERFVIHASIDVIIIDAGSLMTLGHELDMLYSNPATTLPALELSFRDFVLTQVEFEKSTIFARSLAYWRSRSEDFAAGPELPLARSPGSIASPRFFRHNGFLPLSTWERIKARGARAGLSPSGVVLTAFADVLARWSGSTRFSITVTLFNRLPFHPQVNDIVGDFTSITFVEIDLGDGSTFEERARRTQSQLIEALEHRYVSGVRVLRELARARGSAPSIPIVYTSTLGLPTPVVEEGHRRPFELVESITQTPQVWIDHQMGEVPEGLDFHWDAVDELFPEGMLDDAFAAYTRLLTALGEESAWQRKFADLTPPNLLERRAALFAEATGPVPDGLLHEHFRAMAEKNPRLPAVIAASKTLDYEELNVRSDALARKLRSAGARPDTLVGVVMRKGWEQIVAVLAILKAGAAYLPVDAALPEERKRHVLDRGEVRLVVTRGSEFEEPELRAGREIFTVGVETSAESPPVLDSVQDSSQLAYVLFTSGSTGAPKGVMISHRAVLNTIADVQRRYPIGPQDRLFGISSLSFDLSVYDVFGALTVGAAIVLPDADAVKEPAQWYSLVDSCGVTVWNSVPALVRLFVEHVRENRLRIPQSLRRIMMSGDWIPVMLPSEIRAVSDRVELVSLGGPTEATIWQASYAIGEVDPAWSSIPYGKALANHRLHVLDPELEPCPDWVVGEIYIGGEGLARGYWKDEERTAASFISHPRTGERLYKSGDLARFRADGVLEFAGRNDSQVKVQGNRIELGEIEAALDRFPGVEHSAVAAFGGRGETVRLAGFVVPRRDLSDVAFADDARVRWNRALSAARAHQEANPWPYSQEEEERTEAYASRAFAAYVGRMFATLGFFKEAGVSMSVPELLSSAKFEPRFHRWLHRALANLVARGHLLQEGDRYVAPAAIACESPDAIWAELGDRAGTVHLEFLRQTSENLLAILRGETQALEVLFKEGETAPVEELYVQGILGRCIATASELVDTFVEAWPEGRPLRILEIGAGVGALSKALFPLLPRESTTYWYTDLSKYFMQTAREKFADVPFLRFEIFNCEFDPFSQGIPVGEFDLVLASSVLHGTRSLYETFRNIRSLLAPSGALVFIDQTHFSHLLDLSYSFQQGFDRFETDDLRTTNPFATTDGWFRAMLAAGLIDPMVCAEPGIPVDKAGTYVFGARAPATRVLDPAAVRAHLRAILPDYMVPPIISTVDSIPLSPNGKVNRKLLKEPTRREEVAAKVATAPRNALEELLVGIWSQVLERDAVGTDEAFFDLGGDSLLAMRLVALTNRVLRVEATLRLLFLAPTVAALAKSLSLIGGGEAVLEERAKRAIKLLGKRDG